MKLNNKKGISLIVLVITIIVMIILAAAIILSLSSNGIIGRANEAKTSSDVANAKQVVAMAKAEWELMSVEEQAKYSNDFSVYGEEKLNDIGISAGKSEAGSYYITSYEQIYKYPVIPEGFSVSIYDGETELEDGLVVYETTVSDLESKTNEEAKKIYNQYVWVPVPDFNQFTKIDWGKGKTGADFTERLNDYDVDVITEAKTEADEYKELKASVAKYGGFYIARYEAGLPSGITSGNYGQKTDGSAITLPVSMKEKKVWVSIPWDLSFDVKQTKNMYGVWENPGAPMVSRSIYDTNVKSHLIYGVEWDAALKFIATNSSHVNYPIDSTNKGHFDASSSILSGADDKTEVNNIYDMAGNVSEWTMETFLNPSNVTPRGVRIVRGAGYWNSSNSLYSSAAQRATCNPKNTGKQYGFRVALYIK